MGLKCCLSANGQILIYAMTQSIALKYKYAMLTLLLGSIKYFNYPLPMKIFGLFMVSLVCDGV